VRASGRAARAPLKNRVEGDPGLWPRAVPALGLYPKAAGTTDGIAAAAYREAACLRRFYDSVRSKGKKKERKGKERKGERKKRGENHVFRAFQFWRSLSRDISIRLDRSTTCAICARSS